MRSTQVLPPKKRALIMEDHLQVERLLLMPQINLQAKWEPLLLLSPQGQSQKKQRKKKGKDKKRRRRKRADLGPECPRKVNLVEQEENPSRIPLPVFLLNRNPLRA